MTVSNIHKKNLLKEKISTILMTQENPALETRLLFEGSPYDLANYFKAQPSIYQNWKNTEKSINYIYNEKTKLWTEVESEDELILFITDKLKKMLLNIPSDCEYYQLYKTDFNRINKQWCSFENSRNIYRFLQPALRDNHLFDKLDCSDFLLPIKDGQVVDLKTGEIYPRTREHYFTYEINFEPTDNKKKIKKVKKFLKQLANNNDIRYKYLIKILGCCLTGHIPQKIFVFTGEGSNGKSTLTNLLKELLSGAYKTIDPTLVIGKSNKEHKPRPELLELREGRMYVVEETEEGEKLNQKFIKNLSGGDEFSARQLFSKKLTKFHTRGKLIICSNNLPEFNFTDKAMLRRIVYLHFGAVFTDNPQKENEFEKDPTFIEYFKNNLMDAFLTVLINGALKYTSDYNLENPEGLNDINTYLNSIDRITKWFDEKIEKDSKGKLQKSIVWQNYKAWSEEQGYPPYKREIFDKRIIQLLGKETRDGRLGYIYKGYSFKSLEDDEDDDTISSQL